MVSEHKEVDLEKYGDWERWLLPVKEMGRVTRFVCWTTLIHRPKVVHARGGLFFYFNSYAQTRHSV